MIRGFLVIVTNQRLQAEADNIGLSMSGFRKDHNLFADT